MLGTIGAGDDVEAWCTRCRMNLNHRIIAVVGRDIKRVHCLTCGSDHKYYPPKSQPTDSDEEPRARKSAASTARATQTRQRDKPERSARGEWTTFMQEMPEGTVPRSYKTSESYQAGEFIEHAVFGTGKVLAVAGRERIEVIFCDGRKTLIFNKKT